MMETNKTAFIASYLEEILPDAKCSLHFENPFECIVAVSLSAQTTDESVNRVTPALFSRFPTPFALAEADITEVEGIIKSLGLYHNKAKNLIALSKDLVARYNGLVPSDKKELVTLAGVGIKTANVVAAECFGIPAIAVDTHVARVSKRLGLAKASDEPVQIEKKLERIYPSDEWIPLHHRIIWFGRKICHAQSPECGRCGLNSLCAYFKKASKTAGK